MSEFDFSNVIGIKSQHQGEIKAITDAYGVEVWRSRMPTNQVPISTDTDGSIYNGVGYKDNVRLSSSGGVSGSSQSGTVTTGFFPVDHANSIIRMKGANWVSDGKHYYLNYYDANKNFLCYMSMAEYEYNDHVFTMSVENGVTTFAWNTDYGTTHAALQKIRASGVFARICANGKGADLIVTVDEEILI